MKLFLLAVILSLSSNIVYAQADDSEHPNFIIILADDLGYNDLSSYDASLIETPNIDKMAKEGVKFTSFYAQPVCGPARASLMTGSYPLRIAEVGGQRRRHPILHPAETTIAELLKKKNYTTGAIGKWDMSGHHHNAFIERPDLHPLDHGFDYFYGLPSSNDNGARNLYRNRELIAKEYDLDLLTESYTEEALNFIENNKEEPFFLYLAHTMPHVKLGVSPEFKGTSKAGLYGDVIEEMDSSTGRIMEKLKQLDLSENTYVIFASDNGPWLVKGDHGGSAWPLRGGKVTTWEGGVRVPLLVWGPGIVAQNKTYEGIVTIMDFYPTIAQLANIDLPDVKIDGRDISKILQNPQEDKYAERVYLYYLHTHLQAVRKGKWKLVLERPHSPPWLGNWGVRNRLINKDMEEISSSELYNLDCDVSERKNVASDYPAIVKELQKIADNARMNLGDHDRYGKQSRSF